MPRSRQTRRPPTQQQTRSAHTQTRQAPAQQAPSQHLPSQQQTASAAPMQQPRQPGLFSQMASTAAGVAVGSTIGHTMANGVSSMFGGNNQEQPAETSSQAEPYQPQNTSNSCEADAKAFTQCLEATNNDVSSCQWYFDALKRCQSMASQY
ncbi:hypothetical protein BY458DRAFT_535141 [Sporodiniella umbellata]|nr:hypothetical protein BY458DRAFT_535141 [Sporodiniella umbellata]